MVSVVDQIKLEDEYSRAHSIELIREWFAEKNATTLPLLGKIYQTYIDDAEGADASRLAGWVKSIDDAEMDLEDMICNVFVSILSTEIQSLAAVCGSLAGMYRNQDTLHAGAWCVGEMVRLFHFMGFYDAFIGKDGSRYIKAKVVLPEELKEALANAAFLPPMMTVPRAYKDTNDGGYLSFNSSVFTKNGSKESRPNINYLNRQNSVAMALDERVAALPFVVPAKYIEREEQVQFATRWVSTERVIASLKKGANCFWFLYKFDSRGRSYSKGYQLNPQGNSRDKALINFAHTEVVNNEDY